MNAAHDAQDRSGPIHFNVAVNGSDGNPGTADLPFATPAGARDAIRKLPGRGRPVSVTIGAGIYFLDEPLIFTPRDSGSADCPVTYEAAPGQRP